MPTPVFRDYVSETVFPEGHLAKMTLAISNSNNLPEFVTWLRKGNYRFWAGAGDPLASLKAHRHEFKTA